MAFIPVDFQKTISNSFALLGHPKHGFPVNNRLGVYSRPVFQEIGFSPVEDQVITLELLIGCQERYEVGM